LIYDEKFVENNVAKKQMGPNILSMANASPNTIVSQA
jgi:hypothetical protein